MGRWIPRIVYAPSGLIPCVLAEEVKLDIWRELWYRDLTGLRYHKMQGMSRLTMGLADGRLGLNLETETEMKMKGMATATIETCAACGGLMTWDVLEDEWVCCQSGHRRSDRVPDPTLAAEHLNKDKVLKLQLEMFIHAVPLTASPDGGVKSVCAELMLVRQANSKLGTKWRIEYLDTEPIKDYFRGGARNPRGMRDELCKKAIEALQENGIAPDDVRGWDRWFAAKVPVSE